MITEIQIENYKSIQKLKLSLGRVTVFIGENGCGKSNILESIALASAAASNKLDNEFLASRGIRVTSPEFMRSAFEQENLVKEIKINLQGNDETELNFVLQHDNQPYSSWINKKQKRKEELEALEEFRTRLNFSVKKSQELIQNSEKKLQEKTLHRLDQKALLDQIKFLEESQKTFALVEDVFLKERESEIILKNFLIYSPENSSLRIFEKEGQIQPLGVNGEGLLKLLKVLSSDKNLDKINEIKEKLRLIDWFSDFEISRNLSDLERSIQIKDKYLDSELPYFDQRSSNEGFLFLMFYFALFISSDTPDFFAIDNIDASLNPKLCSRLVKELVELAKKYDKQVILTTHNPAILDGLNLDDDEQRLFVIYRNKSGHTKAKRIFKPEPLEGQEPVKLSEAFMRGYIGGLPQSF